MNGTLLNLSVATIVFVGGHFVLSSNAVRRPLVQTLGEWPFRGLYSVLSGLVFAWMVLAYLDAPVVDVFEANTPMRHMSYSVMLISSFFVVCGYSTPNPTAVGMEKSGLASGARGILKVTRHPVMWGTALWAMTHMLANGHLAAQIFFGGLAVLALGGAAHLDLRKSAAGDTRWEAYKAKTSHIPFAAIIQGRDRIGRGEFRWWQIALSIAIYAAMMIYHESFTGFYVMPFSV